MAAVVKYGQMCKSIGIDYGSDPSPSKLGAYRLGTPTEFHIAAIEVLHNTQYQLTEIQPTAGLCIQIDPPVMADSHPVPF